MFGHRFVFFKNFLDVILRQDVKNGGSLVSDLDHTSGGTVIGLHASEVPSCKLLLVDDTVTVEIKILKSSLELILIQRLTKKLRELLKLLSINSSVTVLIELLEGCLDSLS